MGIKFKVKQDNIQTDFVKKNPSQATWAHRTVLISRFCSPQPDTSIVHCETVDMGLVHRMVSLFTPQLTSIPSYSVWCRGTWVWTTCPESLRSSALAGDRTCHLLIVWRPTVTVTDPWGRLPPPLLPKRAIKIFLNVISPATKKLSLIPFVSSAFYHTLAR